MADQMTHDSLKSMTDRTRQRFLGMTRGEDIEGVLKELDLDLKALIPAIEKCSVQVLDSQKAGGVSYQVLNQELVYALFITESMLDGSAVGAAWRDQKIVYRRDLQEEDPYDEAWAIQNVYGKEIRCVIDVPFRQGTLAVNSSIPHAFTPADLTILQEVAQVLSEGLIRLEDLRTLEQRNRELEEKNRLLAASEDALRQAKEELELRVQERTTELAVMNEALLRENAERRRAEEQLTISLHEKDLLLKEIHHRVKNNLQVITSLLHFQSLSVDDPQTLKMFRDSQDRIRSIALIHEKLYRSHDLGRVDVGDYLHGLTTDLLRSYEVTPNTIALNVDASRVELNLDTAIPCGLIVNELASNALKYAFPGGRHGEIRISLCADGSRQFVLTVQDNGIGVPESFDFRRTHTLGLQLVNALVEQLMGTIELRRENGTEFLIRFSELDNRGIDRSAEL